MIVISGALVLVALILLIIGVVGPDLTFVYASIGVSLVSLVFLVIGILQRRGETAPAAETAAPAPVAQDEPSDAVTAVIPAQGRGTRTRSEEPPVAETVDEELELGGTVLVVEGRPRYHVDGCRYLSGKAAEEVDVLDAREEGFTPCGVCKPDEALEALADDELADDEPAEDEPAEDELYEDEPAEADVAGEQEVVEEDVPGVEVPEPARRSTTRGRTAAAGPAAAGSARTAKAPAKTPAKAATKAPAKTAAAKAPAKTAATKAPAKAPAKTAAVGRSRAATAQAPGKAAAAAVGSTPAAATAAARPGSVVVIPDRGKFHRADCRYVRDVPEAEVLTKSAASRSGYAACGVCKP